MRVTPFRLSRSATRALVASLGQVHVIAEAPGPHGDELQRIAEDVTQTHPGAGPDERARAVEHDELVSGDTDHPGEGRGDRAQPGEELDDQQRPPATPDEQVLGP